MVDRGVEMIGSLWFTPEEERRVAAFAENDCFNVAIFKHQIFLLDDVNLAIRGIAGRSGGFSNFVIHP